MKTRWTIAVAAAAILAATVAQAEVGDTTVIWVDFNDATNLPTSVWHTLVNTDTTNLYDTTGVETPVQIEFYSGWNGGSLTYQDNVGAWAGTDWEHASRDFFPNVNGSGYFVLSGFNANDTTTVRICASHYTEQVATYTFNDQPATGPGTDHDGVEFNILVDGRTGGKVMEWVLTGSALYTFRCDFVDGVLGYTCLVNALQIERIEGEPSDPGEEAFSIKIDFNDNMPLVDSNEWNELSTYDTNGASVVLNDSTGAASPIEIAFTGDWNPSSGTIVPSGGAWNGTDWYEASRDFFTTSSTNEEFGTIILSGFKAADTATVQVVASHSASLIATYEFDGLPATGPDHDGVDYNVRMDGREPGSGGKIMEWQLTGSTSYEFSLVPNGGVLPTTALVNAMTITIAAAEVGPALRLALLPGPAAELRWDVEGSNYVAQSAAVLGSEPDWSDLPGTPEVDETEWVLTNSLGSDPNVFYRLRKP